MEVGGYILTKGDSLHVVVERKNVAYLTCLAWVLIISVVLEFVNTGLTYKIGLQNTKQVTFLMHFLVLTASMLSVYKYKGFTVKGIVIYFTILVFFAVNYVFFENSRVFLLDTNMLLVYCFYLPIVIFVTGSITDWAKIVPVFQKFSYYAVLLGTINLMGYSGFLNYMGFSYSLLPFIVILYYSFRQDFKLLNLVAFIVGFIDILIFGARAPILFLFTFIVLYEAINFKKTNILLKLAVSCFCLALGSIFFLVSDKINERLIQIADMTQSRFLTKMLGGQLVESNARGLIYEQANDALYNMGVNIYGLFGDRLVVNAVYVHNIFYELLLSFGLIIGSLCILLLSLLIGKRIFFNKDRTARNIALIFTTALFMRYFVSGSFVIEGYFYIFLSVLLNLRYASGVKR